MITGIDFETASELDIGDVGAHQYFQHPSTHILCLAYGTPNRGEGPKIWRPGQPFPPELRHAAAKGWTFVAHNVQFDGTGWKYLLPEEPFPQRWLCTATRASANGLPRGLDEACHALGLPGKDPEGQKALKVMMKPDRKTGLFIDTPELRKDVEHYCGIDLVRMWQIFNATKPLSEDEQAFFDLDWEINARGFAVDAGIVDKILGRLEQAYGELNLRVFDVTGGELGNIASNKQVPRWLSDNGVELPNLQAQTINDALAGRFTPIEDDTVREVLRLRKLSGAKAASKFAAFKQRGMLEDGLLIMRDTFICNGAHTGRHTSKGMQNLKREMLSEQDVDILVNHSPEDARLLIGEPLELAGMAVRPTICARPGKVLLIGDFAQIELRTSFWLSGERDGLQLLRDKQDLYKRVAAEIYGVPVEQVTKEQRQLGKQCVLGCGYGIGAVTFQATCLKYNMHVPLDVCERAVQIFRNTYYPVKAFWYKLEGAICEAIRGRPQQLGPLKFAADANILAIQLPSGRKLRYQRPSLDRDEKIRYWTQDQKTHQWVQDVAWGGVFHGHITQATANCLQRLAMQRLKAEQYEIVLHAYDEVVAEGDEDQLPHYSRVMSLQDETPAWMAGMFISVDSNATRTYRK